MSMNWALLGAMVVLWVATVGITVVEALLRQYISFFFCLMMVVVQTMLVAGIYGQMSKGG